MAISAKSYFRSRISALNCVFTTFTSANSNDTNGEVTRPVLSAAVPACGPSNEESVIGDGVPSVIARVRATDRAPAPFARKSIRDRCQKETGATPAQAQADRAASVRTQG